MSNEWKNTDAEGFTNVYDRKGNVWKMKQINQSEILYILVNPTTDNYKHFNLYVIINEFAQVIEMFKLDVNNRLLLHHLDGIIPDISFNKGYNPTKKILNRITFEQALELISGIKQEVIYLQSPSVTKSSTGTATGAASTVQAKSIYNTNLI
jgi:hypothetical protein